MTQIDFQKMEHNPLALKKGELMQEKYSYFSKRDVFCVPLIDREIDEENPQEVNERDDTQCLSDLIKFVVLYISKDSPYWDDENFDLRTEGCLKWAGITKNMRAYEHITGQSAWFNEILTSYFIYIDNSLYNQWVSSKISFNNLSAFLRIPFSDDPEKTGKAHIEIQKNLTTMRLAIDKLQGELFPKDKKVERRLKEALENKESVVGYAETRAKYVPT